MNSKQNPISLFVLILIVLSAILWSVQAIRLTNLDGINIQIGLMAIGMVFIISSLRIKRAKNISQAKFNALYFGWMGIRMLTALSTIGIYLIISKLPNKIGVIFLLISYFIYMCFEIRIILHKLRLDSEKSQNADNARK